ncbi:hypothetical protein T11_14957, partial [Trichinella zimbabwensis]
LMENWVILPEANFSVHCHSISQARTWSAIIPLFNTIHEISV